MQHDIVVANVESGFAPAPHPPEIVIRPAAGDLPFREYVVLLHRIAVPSAVPAVPMPGVHGLFALYQPRGYDVSMSGRNKLRFFDSRTPVHERGDRQYELRAFLTREQFEFLEEICKRQSMNAATLVKLILADYMDRVARQKGYESGVNWERVTQTRAVLDRQDNS